MILSAETIEQLNNLRTAINNKNVTNFEAALEELVKQNQVKAINHFFDAAGLNPLHLALALPNAADIFDNANFKFNDLKVSYSNDDTYGKFTTAEKIKTLRMLGINGPKLPQYHETVKTPYRLYFLWRLLSFPEINPNIKTQPPNATDIHPTALHRVIPLNDQLCFELLMNRQDLCLNVAGLSNILPIHVAVDCQSLVMVKALIERGANLNLKAHIGGGNYKPLALATVKLYPNIVEVLLEFGAGIGANISLGDLLTAAANSTINIDDCAFFGASINNVNYNGDPIFHAWVNNETPGFEYTAISSPWEEKLIPLETDANKFTLAKPSFPFLKHYDHLQQRCFELIKEQPDNEYFKKLALYFGAFLTTKTIISKTVKHEMIDGKIQKKIIEEEKTVHGTLKSLAAYTLATNKDKHQDALDHYAEQLQKRQKSALAFKIPDEATLAKELEKVEIQTREKLEKKDPASLKEPIEITVAKAVISKKIDITAKTHLKNQMEPFDCESAVNCANDVYKQALEPFNIDDVQDKINFKKILTRIDQQLHSLNWNPIFNLFHSHDFGDIQRAALIVLIYVAIIGAALFLLAFLVGFIITAVLTLPIFPAIMFGLFTALICVGPSFLGGLIVPAGMAGVSAAIEVIDYLIEYIKITKSLNELADEVRILPSLMSEQSQHLLADLLDGPLKLQKLRDFITTYRAEIQEKLNSNFIDELKLENHIPEAGVNWQFYPPKRENNVNIDEEFVKEGDTKEMGLFEGMMSAAG